METNIKDTNDALTQQDINMLWSLRDGKIPSLFYDNQVRILDVSVDYNALRNFLEERILLGRNWGRATLGEQNGAIISIDSRDNFLGITPEVVYAHAKAMGRKNTWANRRWRDRSDNFFGEGFIGPDYSVMPYKFSDDKSESHFVAGEMIVPYGLKIVLPKAAARIYFSERIQNVHHMIKQLEGRLTGLLGTDVMAKDLPIKGSEFGGLWDHDYVTHLIFSPLWGHEPVVDDERFVTMPLYLENGYGEKTTYHIIDSDKKNGKFGSLSLVYLLSNGQPADAAALKKYDSFLGKSEVKKLD